MKKWQTIKYWHEAIMIGKNINTNASFITNSRKFALIGDPTKMPSTKTKCSTTSINGNDPTMVRDTFNALEKITITGIVTDENNVINTSFNGTVYPTVYDKEDHCKTKKMIVIPIRPHFRYLRPSFFKGSAEVKNGELYFSFYKPKKYQLYLWHGRISLLRYGWRSLMQEDILIHSPWVVLLKIVFWMKQVHK